MQTHADTIQPISRDAAPQRRLRASLAQTWFAARASRVTAAYELSRSNHPAARANYAAAEAFEAAAWAALAAAEGR